MICAVDNERAVNAEEVDEELLLKAFDEVTGHELDVDMVKEV